MVSNGLNKFLEKLISIQIKLTLDNISDEIRIHCKHFIVNKNFIDFNVKEIQFISRLLRKLIQIIEWLVREETTTH